MNLIERNRNAQNYIDRRRSEKPTRAEKLYRITYRTLDVAMALAALDVVISLGKNLFADVIILVVAASLQLTLVHKKKCSKILHSTPRGAPKGYENGRLDPRA